MPNTIQDWVAVLTPAKDAVDHVEFIAVPVTYKAGRVLPLIDVVPIIPAGKVLGDVEYTIGSDSVTRTWAVVDAPPIIPHLNGGALIRFSATNPITVYENIGMAGVSRLSKGRYRITHQVPMPTDQYSVFPDVMDIVDKRVRYTARTTDYIEVRVVDNAGLPADATEVSVKTERVIS